MRIQFTPGQYLILPLITLLLTGCGGGGGGSGSGNSNKDYQLTLHADKRVAQMILPDSINVDDKTDINAELATITKKLYESFNDNFDFIILVSNNDTQPAETSYAGIYFGLGASSIYGSAGKLKGILHFPKNRSIRFGPSLHEMGHRWTGHKGYSGFSGSTTSPGGGAKASGVHSDADGRGPLGGYAGNQLIDEGGGKYSAPVFGTVANGGNSTPYNGAELFEMGFISKAQAGNIWVPVNAASSTGPTPGRTYFTANSVTEMTYAAYNTTDPDNVANTMRNFKILTVLIDNLEPVSADLDLLANDIEWFTVSGPGNIGGIYNFYEATNGLGTLTSSQLDQDMK